MADVHPVRLRLSREKGFSLKVHSLATNGLLAQNVARPTMWGNPFMVDCYGQEGAVNRFRRLLCGPMSTLEMSQSSHWGLGSLVHDRQCILAAIHKLRGKNLACWCAPDAPCHADVLLDLAKSEAAHA